MRVKVQVHIRFVNRFTNPSCGYITFATQLVPLIRPLNIIQYYFSAAREAMRGISFCETDEGSVRVNICTTDKRIHQQCDIIFKGE